ncbi:MAG: HEAT repeat domain-containing protein [Acidobacteriota bacterium]|nr:HEAT repeat domain-containing protein [Acidobacteriota bacterium]
MSLVLIAGTAAAADRDGAWAVLDKSLSDGNADRRQEALAALSTLAGPNEGAVKRAEAALKDKDPLIRQSAALTLGELGAKDAIPALQAALDDTPEVAFAAAKALTAVGGPGGRDVLVAVLAGERKDAPGMMTNAMRKARDKLHHPEGLFLMGAQDATGAMFGPVSMVIPAIRDASDLKGKGAPGRAAAAAWLAKDPDPYAITLLEWALNDENQLVRVEAAKALGTRGNAESIASLEPLLTNSHNFVRDMAAASIIRVLDRNGEAGPVSAAPITPSAVAKH